MSAAVRHRAPAVPRDQLRSAYLAETNQQENDDPARPWKEIRSQRARRDGPGFEAGVAREHKRTEHEIVVYEQTLAELRRARAHTNDSR